MDKFPSEYSVSNSIFYSPNGTLIDLNIPLAVQIDTEKILYAFRKDLIEFAIPLKCKSPTDFRSFGLSAFYEEPFNFQKYEEFPRGYESIPESENRLFNLTEEAKT